MGWRGRAEERERRDSRKGDIYKKGIQEERAFKVTEIEWKRASKELIKRKERPSEHSVTKMVASFSKRLAKFRKRTKSKRNP